MNDAQAAFVLLYGIYMTLAYLTQGSPLAKPIRLLTTFVHEFSHALACMMTGGSVRQIEVYSNAGGVTRYQGGCRCIIASAGYLGEAIWGFIFVVMSGGRKTATVAAGGLILALLISLCYAPNKTMVWIAVLYSIFTFGCIFIEWFVFTPILNYVVLYFGVFFSYIAVSDIFDHTVVGSRPGSDAYALYEESMRCCLPRCVGFQWFIVAVLLQIGGFVLGYMLLSAECEGGGWIECIFHTKVDFGDWNFDEIFDFK